MSDAQVMVWELKRGDQFTVDESADVFTFDHMDGMYCFARCHDGAVFNWSGPVYRIVETEK